MRILLLLLILIAAQATAQQIGQNASSAPAGTYTLTAKAQLVVETVVVKDKQGKFIPDSALKISSSLRTALRRRSASASTRISPPSRRR